MSSNYRSLGSMPSQMPPAHATAGSSESGPSREYFAMAGRAGHQSYDQSCPIAAPPEPMVYCSPAPFSAQCGQTYFNIGSAYGRARPKGGY